METLIILILLLVMLYLFQYIVHLKRMIKEEEKMSKTWEDCYNKAMTQAGIYMREAAKLKIEKYVREVAY